MSAALMRLFLTGLPCAEGGKHGLRAAAPGAASGTASGAAGLAHRGPGPAGTGPLRAQERVPWGTLGSKIQAWEGAGQEWPTLGYRDPTVAHCHLAVPTSMKGRRHLSRTCGHMLTP